MLLRQQLSSLPEFRWCLAPGCQSGQLHLGGTAEPRFVCESCGHCSCVKCDVPWHDRESCSEYQYRKSEGPSYDTISATTKPCPKCQSRIEKNEGCDHMTCTSYYSPRPICCFQYTLTELTCYPQVPDATTSSAGSVRSTIRGFAAKIILNIYLIALGTHAACSGDAGSTPLDLSIGHEEHMVISLNTFA